MNHNKYIYSNVYKCVPTNAKVIYNRMTSFTFFMNISYRPRYTSLSTPHC